MWEEQCYDDDYMQEGAMGHEKGLGSVSRRHHGKRPFWKHHRWEEN